MSDTPAIVLPAAPAEPAGPKPSLMTGPKPLDVLINFTPELEIHDLKAFQAAGHFVPGMKDRNNWPNERPFEGELVYILTLNVKDEFGNVRLQVCRAYGDSDKEVALAFADQVRALVTGYVMLQQATQGAKLNFEQQAADLEALRKHIDADGPGKAVDIIREARVRAALG